jgi:hypothetical protein
MKVLRQRRHDKPVTALTFSSKLASVPRDKSCSLMSVFKLANDHPLTKAGLRCVHAVEEAGRGLRPGDIVFEFPFGHIVDTGMACRRYGIIPSGIDILGVQKEATAARAARNEQDQEVRRPNVLPFRL